MLYYLHGGFGVLMLYYLKDVVVYFEVQDFDWTLIHSVLRLTSIGHLHLLHYFCHVGVANSSDSTNLEIYSLDHHNPQRSK